MSNNPKEKTSRKKLLFIGDNVSDKTGLISSIKSNDMYDLIEPTEGKPESEIANTYRQANRCYICVDLSQDETTIETTLNLHLKNTLKYISYEQIVIIGINVSIDNGVNYQLPKIIEYAKKHQLISKIIKEHSKNPTLENLNFYTTCSDSKTIQILTNYKSEMKGSEGEPSYIIPKSNVSEIIDATKSQKITLHIVKPITEKEWKITLNQIKNNINIVGITFDHGEVQSSRLTPSGPGFKYQIEIMDLLKKRADGNNDSTEQSLYISNRDLQDKILGMIKKQIDEIQSTWSYIFKRSTTREQALMELYSETFYDFNSCKASMLENTLNDKPFLSNDMKVKNSILRDIEKKISQSQYSLGIFVKGSLRKESALNILYQRFFSETEESNLKLIFDKWKTEYSSLLNPTPIPNNIEKKSGFFSNPKEIDITQMLRAIDSQISTMNCSRSNSR